MDQSKSAPPGGGQADRIEELKRQVVETRNQMIKTANIVENLSAEVREISRLHQRQNRGLTVNSVGSYVLFVVLITVGFYFVYRSQKERLDFEKGVLTREHAAAKSKLETLQRSVEKRRDTETRAAAFYRLSQSGRVHQALRKYPEVSQLPLSPVESAVFQKWANSQRRQMARSSYNSAMKAVAEEHWKRAALDFATAVQHEPSPPHEASLRYYFGFSLMKLGNYTKAAEQLERAIEVNAEKYVSREVRFYLGTIYEQMGQMHKAKEAYGEYVKRFPATRFARAARRILKQLE